MMLLDTHVLVWLDAGDTCLGKIVLQAIGKAFKENTLFVSTISFREVTLQIQHIKIEDRYWRWTLTFTSIKLCQSLQ